MILGLMIAPLGLEQQSFEKSAIKGWKDSGDFPSEDEGGVLMIYVFSRCTCYR